MAIANPLPDCLCEYVFNPGLAAVLNFIGATMTLTTIPAPQLLWVIDALPYRLVVIIQMQQ
ncbi:UNVERIFIED_CONTAM: hypothetical protein FKN15_060998 [Acipenser sinensis]